MLDKMNEEMNRADTIQEKQHSAAASLEDNNSSAAKRSEGGDVGEIGGTNNEGSSKNSSTNITPVQVAPPETIDFTGRITNRLNPLQEKKQKEEEEQIKI